MSARTILKHVYENGGMTEYQYEKIDRVLKERERPHGEWIARSDGGRIRYPFWERYECSKCGAKSENTNFCPNCGADMRKRGEEK